jgi:zinc D-Ala-D-Ala carboxypeptidase
MYSKNFSIAEFASQDGKDQGARMCPEFMLKLQSLREEFNHSIVVTSGIRSFDHNKAVGGARLSMHLSRPCKACDVAIINWSSSIRHRFLELAFSHGFSGIGVSKNFIHLDTRATKSLWIY